MDKQSKEMQELDADMAKIMKYEVGMREQCKGVWVRVNELNKISDWFDWHPTSNIVQAFDVVEKFPGWNLSKMRKRITRKPVDENLYQCVICTKQFQEYHSDWEDTPALAICQAAKKAWEAK